MQIILSYMQQHNALACVNNFTHTRNNKSHSYLNTSLCRGAKRIFFFLTEWNVQNNTIAPHTYQRCVHTKRDLLIWKETYSSEKRPIHLKRGLLIREETYTCKKGHVSTWTQHTQRRHSFTRTWQRRVHMKRDLLIWKETYSSEKRPLRIQREIFLPEHNV